MLNIRDAQMEALRRAAREDFERRLERHLSGLETPGKTGRPDCAGAIESARAFGITRECDIARYSELMYRHTGGCDPKALPKKAQNILLAYGVEPARKLDQFAAWAAAPQSEDETGDA